MKRQSLILSFAFLLLLPTALFAHDKTDRLVMKNGDSMTCEIKGLDSGVLYVSFDYIDGTASVDWTKVARLESTQLFVVKTEDGSVYTGALRTAETGGGRPAQIQVLEPPEQVHTMERSQVVRIVATSEKVKIAADLINRYPDRFLFCTDEVAPTSQQQYLRVPLPVRSAVEVAGQGSNREGPQRQLRAYL